MSQSVKEGALNDESGNVDVYYANVGPRSERKQGTQLENTTVSV